MTLVEYGGTLQIPVQKQRLCVFFTSIWFKNDQVVIRRDEKEKEFLKYVLLYVPPT